MPATSSYDYAIVRVVPDVERGECINIGVILYCRTLRFLDAWIQLDPLRLNALAPRLDIEALQRQCDHLLCVCAGKRNSGPIGQLSQSERFHWLVAPRSTSLQVSPVHSGLCCDPAHMLDHLVYRLVLYDPL